MRRRDFIAGLLGTSALAAQARPLNLKIQNFKTFVVNAGSVNWVFCKVYTNQGLVGLGEGSVTSKEATVAQAIMDNERLLASKTRPTSNTYGRACSATRVGAVAPF